ncbi:uncharacterized protein EI90DRAFT_2189236 [Cantharellus anzutake]|uniref:uncharacterized protein n=1 Tax=Cantharellus anzutake TaxID=1750568 RepID=UPI0019054EC4|nr:uncharacterized protein EI90DRAFT_2189236 [Cantharellus anzutake]KAF8325285.1 hypothetical protein EI90DRAFT_2189236 [Cantharellus anzutake]
MYNRVSFLPPTIARARALTYIDPHQHISFVLHIPFSPRGLANGEELPASVIFHPKMHSVLELLPTLFFPFCHSINGRPNHNSINARASTLFAALTIALKQNVVQATTFPPIHTTASWILRLTLCESARSIHYGDSIAAPVYMITSDPDPTLLLSFIPITPYPSTTAHRCEHFVRTIMHAINRHLGAPALTPGPSRTPPTIDHSAHEAVWSHDVAKFNLAAIPPTHDTPFIPSTIRTNSI